MSRHARPASDEATGLGQLAARLSQPSCLLIIFAVWSFASAFHTRAEPFSERLGSIMSSETFREIDVGSAIAQELQKECLLNASIKACTQMINLREERHFATPHAIASAYYKRGDLHFARKNYRNALRDYLVAASRHDFPGLESKIRSARLRTVEQLPGRARQNSQAASSVIPRGWSTITEKVIFSAPGHPAEILRQTLRPTPSQKSSPTRVASSSVASRPSDAAGPNSKPLPANYGLVTGSIKPPKEAIVPRRRYSPIGSTISPSARDSIALPLEAAGEQIRWVKLNPPAAAIELGERFRYAPQFLANLRSSLGRPPSAITLAVISLILVAASAAILNVMLMRSRRRRVMLRSQNLKRPVKRQTREARRKCRFSAKRSETALLRQSPRHACRNRSSGRPRASRLIGGRTTRKK